jgi:hypothetical protein
VSDYLYTSVMLVSSRDGEPFSRPRSLGHIRIEPQVAEEFEANLLAGARSVLALWEYPKRLSDEAASGYMIRGGRLGRLGPRRHVALDPFSFEGLIGPDGKAVIVYSHERHSEPSDVRAVTAPAGDGFGASVDITPHERGCSLEGVETGQAATSRGGYAIFAVHCTVSSYLIRYTP